MKKLFLANAGLLMMIYHGRIRQESPTKQTNKQKIKYTPET